MNSRHLLALTLTSIVTLTSCTESSKKPTETPAPTECAPRTATHGKVVYFNELMTRGGNASDVLQQTLDTNSKVVLDFYAEWCGPCKKLGPVLDKLAPKYPDVLFVKINVDDFNSLSKKFDVKGIPALLFYKDGKKVARESGYKSESDMKSLLKKLD